jgi:phosphoglycerate dehydrogenase-like enzyme
MSDQPHLVILNPTCLDVLEGHRAYLDAQPLRWTARESFRHLAPAEVDDALRDAEAIIVPSSIRTLPRAEQMERHHRLKVLSIAASGFDWLDVEAATRHGIVVTNAPVREGVEVVADLTWGLMLAVARQIPQHDRQVRAGCYDRGTGTSVWGKTLGIVGLGQIGRAVARRAAGFQMRVLACDPAPDRAFAREHEIELADLGTVLRGSDFVSLHVRLDGSTRHMIDAGQLRLMKPTAFLINAARAELVQETALVEAIARGGIAGAGLDDPPGSPDCPLTRLPNVVYTPHLGNRAIEGMNAVFRAAIDNALAVLAGCRPEHVVNPAVYDRPWRARQG